MKWKRRAYKMKESKKDGPCTPTKRQAPLTETEVNSPNKMFLDSPKSKFFDVRSTGPVSLNCPTRFFDNSALGTVPGTSSLNFWTLGLLKSVIVNVFVLEVSCLPAEPVEEFTDNEEEGNVFVFSGVRH